MTTKVRNTSASVADKLTESVEAALARPTGRAAMVAALRQAIVDDTAVEKATLGELEEAERLVQECEYTRLRGRLADARAAAARLSMVPTPATDAARRALIEAMGDEEREALHRLDIDINNERGRLMNADNKSAKKNKAINERLAALREPHNFELEADVLAAVAKFREQFGLREVVVPKFQAVQFSFDEG